MNIASGNENITSDNFFGSSFNQRWQIDTGTNTSIVISNSTAATITNTASLYITGEDGNNYVYRKSSRQTKKKRGDKSGANSKYDRLKVLKPVVAFRYVKGRFNLLQQRKLSSRLERVCKMLETAKTCNQIALRDKIMDKFGQFLREQEMIACGFNQFIEKKILQAFVDSCEKKVIKLTKVQNYIRVIPKSVRAKLERARKAKLFDEYLVLHTDPDDKSVEKTREEKKDPILFGVIAESTRYYVIDDWEDEFCDITMDKIMDTLGLEDEEVELDENVEKALLELLI